MKTVYTLQHSYGLEECDEVKFIGVYTSEKEAKKAINRLSNLPGFSNKIDGFQIDKIEVNKDHWTEGFSTLVTIQTKDFEGKWIAVTSELLTTGNYQIIEKHQNHLLGEFKDGDIVKCEERKNGFYAIEKIKNS